MHKIRKIIREVLYEGSVHPEQWPEDQDWTNHKFNSGDCDVYAVSLHRLYNYPLYAIRGKFLEPEWGGKREWDYEYCHIMVKLPNGNYMDSDGELTDQEAKDLAMFNEDVKKIEIIPVTEEEALSTFSCTDQEPMIKSVMKHISSKVKK